MSKYEPLGEHLRRSGSETIRLAFKEVERIVGFKLPGSAYRHSAWWSNNPTGHSHARAWVSAGWSTEQVDTSGEVLVFRRKASPDPVGGPHAADELMPKCFGALRGTVRFAADFDPIHPTGEIWDAQEGRL